MKKYVKSIIMVVLLTLLIYSIGLNWYIVTQNNWVSMEHPIYEIDVPECPQIPSKNTIRKLVQKEFRIICVCIDTNNIGDGTDGRAIPQLNFIFIRQSLEGLEYTIALSHEMAHCKFKSNNECYAEFKAVVQLLESKDEYLNYVGKFWANKIMSGLLIDKCYECGYYLDKYLKGEQYGRF